jgi:hypothetical protein
MDGCGQQLRANVVGGAIGGGAMLIGDVLDDITKVAQQVPPIRDLYGVGSALTDPVWTLGQWPCFNWGL